MSRPEIIPSLWYAKNLNDYRADEYHQVDDYTKANLIGSRYPIGSHAILLDLDCKHEYRESSTPGHGHLVIQPHLGGIDWYDYRKLLELLSQLGVIETTNYQWAIQREQVFLRLPHIRKGQGDAVKKLLELLEDTA